MKKYKMFLLLTLILLLLGITYATDTKENTTSIEDTVANKIQTTSTPTQIIEDNTNSEEHQYKEINKQYENKTKTASLTIDVNDFNTLHNTLIGNQYDTVTINIKSNIILTDYTYLSSKIRQLTINGNGKTIYGNNNRFLGMDQPNTVQINNINIINCNSSFGGAIFIEGGVLNITKSTLNNNTASDHYGGAIFNNGELTINNSTLNNNKANYDGGAIRNYGELTLINSTLNNNTSTGQEESAGGGAIRNDGKLIINNSTLTNNTSNNGGAIYNHDAWLIIINSTLNNNNAYEDYGGAIYNYGTSNIIQSTLFNNTANNGGAIYYKNGTSELLQSTLYNNTANNGGAIYHKNEFLTINKTIINNNTAKNGGAIRNTGNLILTNSTLNNNNANNYGGAIYNNKKTSINKCLFENNTANQGSAIYSKSQITINNNTFKKNKADNLIPPAINDNATGTIIKDNQNDNNSSYYSTIYIEGVNNNITNNIFNDEKSNLKITIDPIKTVTYGHNVTITGTLTDTEENILTNATLKVYINGKSKTTQTDNIGKFNLTSKVGTIGSNNVTISYSGDINYYPTNTSTTFTMIKQNLQITVNTIKTIKYGNNITITGTFTDADGNPRANNNLKININGKNASATTDNNGKYTFTSKIGKPGTNNITISHPGGANYNPTSTNTTYTVEKQDLNITLENIDTMIYGPVTIKGKLTDALGNIRSNTGVKLLINGKSTTAKTDKNGEFLFTTKACKVGINNITASHNGGANYNPTNTTITFNMVKQDLLVTIDQIHDVTYGNNVMITGKLTDASGKIRANTNLKVTINGKTLTTKTDSNGCFNATSKVGNVGVNNVTITHNGGTGFNPISTSTTFTMIKQDLKITINPISNIKIGSTVTVTGTFTDANDKIRVNTNLKVNYNGKAYTTTTDTKGEFIFTATANTLGINTVTISHSGGANYNPTDSTATFTITK